VSPEPLRHEPGPRDWSPSGGYQYESSTTRPTPASRTLTRPSNRPPRTGRSLDLGTTALIIGILSFGVAAFYFPETPMSGTIVYSAVGLLAVLAGIQSRRAWKRGIARRRWPAWWGIALGLIALASTAAALSNQTNGTTLPSLPDATSAIVAAITAPSGQPAVEPAAEPITQPPTPADGAAQVPATTPQPISEPPVVVTATPTFSTADDEYLYLAQSVGTTVFLIGQRYGDGAPEALYVSDTGYTYLAPDGSVMVGADSGVRPGFALTGDGGYTLSLTGTQFGTTAYYDSRVGQILRG